jgi:hypothetical protein
MDHKKIMIMEQRSAFLTELHELMEKHGASINCTDWERMTEECLVWFSGRVDESGHSWCVDASAI